MPGATALAVVMLVISFLLLLAINLLQWWSNRVQRNQSDMTDDRNISATAAAASPERAAVRVRWLLIAIALVFLGLFLVVPLVAVFAEALAQGPRFLFSHAADPMTLSAIKLTFIAAGISVPLNCIFGVAAAWAIAKFDFPGKNILHHAD